MTLVRLHPGMYISVANSVKIPQQSRALKYIFDFESMNININDIVFAN